MLVRLSTEVLLDYDAEFVFIVTYLFEFGKEIYHGFVI